MTKRKLIEIRNIYDQSFIINASTIYDNKEAAAQFSEIMKG
jgi:hypothetical protein